jgi:hypothetical protein
MLLPSVPFAFTGVHLVQIDAARVMRSMCALD